MTDRQTLRGGVWVDGFSVTWPFATLSLDRSHAEIRAPFVSPVQFRRDEVLGVRWRRLLLARGLRFTTATGRLDRVTFWPVPSRAAQRALERLGWWQPDP